MTSYLWNADRLLEMSWKDQVSYTEIGLLIKRIKRVKF